MLFENVTLEGITIVATIPTRQQEFTTPGTYYWTVPDQVTSISAVAVGSGGGGGGQGYGTGGSGGSLSYLNNYAVTPGQVLTIVVAAPGKGRVYDNVYDPSPSANSGFSSTIVNNGTTILKALGGDQSGTNIGTASYNGGTGGTGWYDSGANCRPGSGGGAGGYSGSGGNGGSGAINTKCAGSAGSGGGGGGGAVWIANGYRGSGGGVGIYGQGTSGTGGNPTTQNDSVNFAGGGGSGGNNGSQSTLGAEGGSYGGGGSGGAGGYNSTTSGRDGGQGAVRIIWPGDIRQFPSTRTANE